MKLVLRMESRVIGATRALAIVGFVALLLVALTTMVDVALRWLASAPIKGLNDINGLAIAIVIGSCLPLVVARRQNISIRFLGEAAGPAAARWLDAFGSAVLLVFVSLVAWQLARHTAGMAESGRTTWHLRIPVTPYWSVATLLVALCIPAQTIALIADVGRAITGAPPRAEDVAEDADGATAA